MLPMFSSLSLKEVQGGALALKTAPTVTMLHTALNKVKSGNAAYPN
jgi:hypothetical protein